MKKAFFESTAWPFEEARTLLQNATNKSCVTFETGYGASGLPHIGTFGEVVRTSFVRHAFACMSDIPTRLLCISDDMDGLRKVPDNIPNRDKMQEYIDFPLTAIPDPFETYSTFGEHNNHRLQTFLSEFGFDFTFISSTQCYKSGVFDAVLLEVLQHHREILDILLPTLGEERQKTYSPFLPISPLSGRILQVPILEYGERSIVFRDEDGNLVDLPVTGGTCKLQWKVDWGARWKAFSVDYEMAGKDLIDSVTIATQVCRVLGGVPPQTMIFEHFLDEEGRKISKSKGNGVSIEQWRRYAPVESLAYFMYPSPRRAKRLYLEMIPRSVDEYLQHLDRYPTLDIAEALKNLVWHIHAGNPPAASSPISFSLLLNLVSACHGQDTSLVWGFIQRQYPQCTPENNPKLAQCVDYAVTYYHEIVAPKQVYRAPTQHEGAALSALIEALRAEVSTDAESLQTCVYEVGKRFFPVLKDWFSCLYQVLLGQDAGPRMGSFIALYGVEAFCQWTQERLDIRRPEA